MKFKIDRTEIEKYLNMEITVKGEIKCYIGSDRYTMTNIVDMQGNFLTDHFNVSPTKFKDMKILRKSKNKTVKVRGVVQSYMRSNGTLSYGLDKVRVVG